MNGEMFVPIFLFGGAAAVLIVYYNTRHKERMAMIEKGVNPAEFKGAPIREWFKLHPLSSLKWGLLFASVGIGLMFAEWLHRSYDVSGTIFPASIFLAGGIALIFFYLIAAKKMKQEQG